MQFLVDTIRQIELGKIEIDRSPKWIRSNVGTNEALNKLTASISKFGFSNIPSWVSLYSLVANADKIEPSKVNMEMTKLQHQVAELNRKLEEAKKSNTKLAQANHQLYIQYRDLQRKMEASNKN